jgi:rubrerythrin
MQPTYIRLKNGEVKVGESAATDMILGDSWKEVANMWAPIHVTNEQLECTVCAHSQMQLRAECPICGTSKPI